MRRSSLAVIFLALVALLVTGCGADTSSKSAAASRAARSCPGVWQSGWQQLANRIKAPVYCPAWLPDPLTGQITGHVSYGGSGGYSLSVDKDRSYLASFAWAERDSGEVHVNLRGYPGRTAIPVCVESTTNRGKRQETRTPCFNDERGKVSEGGITATVYTVNQDADLWHVLYAWRYKGSLYTVSEHVAEPLTYKKVVANLHRMLASLVLVDPSS